jgi:hypothetical protein
MEEGCEFFKDGGRKHRYVGIYGDRRIKRILRRALRWKVLPYPKRHQSSNLSVSARPVADAFEVLLDDDLSSPRESKAPAHGDIMAPRVVNHCDSRRIGRNSGSVDLALSEGIT